MEWSRRTPQHRSKARARAGAPRSSRALWSDTSERPGLRSSACGDSAEGNRHRLWDGTHVPQALRELPPGRYAVEPIDNLPPLTPEEDTGILAALDQLDAGRGIPLADVVREIRRGSSKR